MLAFRIILIFIDQFSNIEKNTSWKLFIAKNDIKTKALDNEMSSFGLRSLCGDDDEFFDLIRANYFY
jgi:hypothetical protein